MLWNILEVSGEALVCNRLTMIALPKSANLSVLSVEMSKFSGLISQCVIPSLWMYSIAFKRWMENLAAFTLFIREAKIRTDPVTISEFANNFMIWKVPLPYQFMVVNVNECKNSHAKILHNFEMRNF